MKKDKRNKSILPLIIGGGALYLLSRSRNKSNTINNLTDALKEQRQNNAYKVLLTDDAGDEYIDKIINSDFISPLNELPNYNPLQIGCYILPDTLNITIGQFTRAFVPQKHYYKTSTMSNKGVPFPSYYNDFICKSGDYYVKFSMVLCIYIPKSGYEKLNLSQFDIANINIEYGGRSQLYPTNGLIFLDYLYNNELSQFWTPSDYGFKTMPLVTDRFKQYMDMKKITLKNGFNYFNLEFILPQKYYKKDGSVDYQIYMNWQNKNINDYDALTMFQLAGISFDVFFTIPQLDSSESTYIRLFALPQTYTNGEDYKVLNDNNVKTIYTRQNDALFFINSNNEKKYNAIKICDNSKL